MGKTLAYVMAVEQVLVAIAYLYQGDYRHAIYWVLGAAMIVVVTY